MALKEIDVTIKDGRDAGKVFHIKEWPAIRTEAWVLRAALGLGRAGVQIPPEILQMGAGPTALAIASQAMKIPSRLGLKLADELMECVTIVEPKVTRSLVANDIEDLSTRLWLKGQVLKVLFGFFADAAFQNLKARESGAPRSSDPSTSTQSSPRS